MEGPHPPLRRRKRGERERKEESLGDELNPSVSSSSGTAAASFGSPGAGWSLAASPSLLMTVILAYTPMAGAAAEREAGKGGGGGGGVLFERY